MGMSLYSYLKPVLFSLDPETAHGLVFRVVGQVSRWSAMSALQRALFTYDHPVLRCDLLGHTLPNPVGLAAGFDKDGLLAAPLLGLGFGLAEFGGVTPRPQPGNARPRIFRLSEDEALINRMGFNNRGAAHLAERLALLPASEALIGVNLGKNLDTPLERASADFIEGLRSLHDRADYMTINVSSPNTPGLRSLQRRDSLQRTLEPLCAERDALARRSGKRMPLLVKLAPDLARGEMEALVEVAITCGVDGLIATNTAVSRDGLRSPLCGEEGGLSGRPIFARTLAVVSALYRLTAARLPIIGVGGIFSAEDVYALVRAGASAVQIYTALIYRGPGLVREIKKGLVNLLQRDGFTSVTQAVGTAAADASSSDIAEKDI